MTVRKWGLKVRLYEEDAHWWRCPNDPPCPHAGVFHDIEEPGDPIPTCCFDGCTCGHVPADIRAAAWAALTDESELT